MNLFGHWVPSLLHSKADRLAAFLLSCKILKKVIPVQFHITVMLVCVHVVEYVSSTGGMSFLCESLRDSGEISSWVPAMLHPQSHIQQFLSCITLSADKSEAVLKDLCVSNRAPV